MMIIMMKQNRSYLVPAVGGPQAGIQAEQKMGKENKV